MTFKDLPERSYSIYTMSDIFSNQLINRALAYPKLHFLKIQWTNMKCFHINMFCPLLVWSQRFWLISVVIFKLIVCAVLALDYSDVSCHFVHLSHCMYAPSMKCRRYITNPGASVFQAVSVSLCVLSVHFCLIAYLSVILPASPTVCLSVVIWLSAMQSHQDIILLLFVTHTHTNKSHTVSVSPVCRQLADRAQ